jgi:chemotaxis protein methyltransferase CheR
MTAPAPPPPREFAFTWRDFDFLRRLANERTGIVVSDDKLNMFYSRPARRLRHLGLPTVEAYCQLLRSDEGADEVPELVNAITTNLTSFFREHHHFDFLARRLVPELAGRAGRATPVRVWSAGCSTGEEPYSIAITLGELLPAPQWELSVLATDIDSHVRARAARGVYLMDRVRGIPVERLRRWFLRGKGANEGKARVRPELHRLVHFEQLNLMAPWAVEPMDVIFCRNVIIYFDKPTKARLVERFAGALREGGYLFVGHSESLYKVSERFQLVGNTVYRKVA